MLSTTHIKSTGKMGYFGPHLNKCQKDHLVNLDKSIGHVLLARVVFWTNSLLDYFSGHFDY